MRQFQDLGHRAVLIIGDYTARIGDPTGQSSTRPMLTQEQIKRNAETYFQQAGKILDTSQTKLEVRYNSDWLEKMTLMELIQLAAKKTVAQMLQRDSFKLRLQNNIDVYTHEFIYPLMQGYDSIVVKSDVELGHYRNDFTFDFTNTNSVYADVYAVDDSALSTNIGLWDQHWLWPNTYIGTDFEYLMKPGEWRTIPFYVGGLNLHDLNHIEAFVFAYLAGTSGTIYLDNLRVSAPLGDCHCARRVEFSGYTWCVLQSTWPMDAGPNCYTADQKDVYVDANGLLHMSIIYKDPNWYCSGLVATDKLGYGKYIYTVDANTDRLDPNTIVGLFVYDVCDPCGYHEIDVELTRWGDSADTNNAQFVVQPFDPCRPLESRDRFKITYSTTVVTHEFLWNPNVVAFRSYYGEYSPNPSAEAMIRSWSYAGPNVPRTDKDNPRINFYLTKGAPPQNNQNAEVIVKSFRYLSLGDLDSDGDVDLQDFALFSDKWLWDIE